MKKPIRFHIEMDEETDKMLDQIQKHYILQQKGVKVSRASTVKIAIRFAYENIVLRGA